MPGAFVKGSPIATRFWCRVRVDDEDKCWVWTGLKTGGYGRIEFNGKQRLAHVISYILHYGVDPRDVDKWVCHHCENPSCVNPNHLYLGDRGRGATPLKERFWANVAKLGPNDCWPWTGLLDEKGYAHISVNGKRIGAHRASMMLHGFDPIGKFVCHHCDNPRCVNPKHLYLGDPASNTRDMMERGRYKSSRHACYARGKDHHWAGKHVGEDNGRAKLTESDVVKIRKAHADGAIVLDTAKHYGTTRECIYNLLNGKSWKHVK